MSDVAQFVSIEPPLSVAALSRRLDSLPDSVPFHSTIVTGTALGGEVNLTLRGDGSYTFSGFMRATGFPSFSFRVIAIVRSASGQVMVAAQHSGKVFGTDTPGNRENNWNETGSDSEQLKKIRNNWPDISGGTLAVSRSSELSGVLGVAVDVIKDVAEFLLAAATLGTGPAVCLVLGSELSQVGASLPGLGGVGGLGVVGGVVYIWGPSAILPAIVAGVAAGKVIDTMVKIRSLHDDERAFARQVFTDSLNFDRIRLTNLSGLQGRCFTVPTLDGTILINVGPNFDNPARATIPGVYPVAGQFLIHELTHAWQIEHSTLKDGFVPGYLCRGISNQVQGQKSYRYGPPGQPWGSFHMEAQGAIVDQWFGGNGVQEAPGMNPNSPYFGYITNNVRLGVP